MSCASTGKTAKIIHHPDEQVIHHEPSMDSAIKKIKQDSQDIKKYYTADQNGEIIVQGELTEKHTGTGKIEHFEISYSLAGMVPDKSGVYQIHFTVKSIETGDTIRDHLLWKPHKNTAGILLSFDDDYMNVWENYFDLFDKYRAKVTFFVQGKYTDFCKTAVKKGHDIGYHSLNHPNLKKVSREDFIRETLSQIDVFRSAGIPLVSFAYPYGFSEPWMNEELLRHYRILRNYSTEMHIYDRLAVQNRLIISRAIDNTLFTGDEDFNTAINSMLLTVKFLGGNHILPLTSHTISDTAAWGIKPRRLQYLLEKVHELQLNFYTYHEITDNKH